MAIQVVARGQVARYLPDAKTNLTVTWTEPITVLDLLKSIGLDTQLVTVVVNGQRVTAEHVLMDEDKVLLFSPMAGG